MGHIFLGSQSVLAIYKLHCYLGFIIIHVQEQKKTYKSQLKELSFINFAVFIIFFWPDMFGTEIYYCCISDPWSEQKMLPGFFMEH